MENSIKVDIVLTNATELHDIIYYGTAQELDTYIRESDYEDEDVFVEFEDAETGIKLHIPADKIAQIGFDEEDLPEEEGDKKTSLLDDILTQINSMDFFKEDEDKSDLAAEEAMKDLSNTERTILTMFYLGGRTYGEIAKALDMDVEEVADIRKRAADRIYEKAEGALEGKTFCIDDEKKCYVCSSEKEEDELKKKVEEALSDGSHESESIKKAAAILEPMLKENWTQDIVELKDTALWIAPVIADIADTMFDYDTNMGIFMRPEHYMEDIAEVVANNQQKYEKLRNASWTNHKTFDAVKFVLLNDYISIIRTDIK